MASDNYIKIFQGSFIESNRLVVELKNINISPIIKNEMESARLAGFGSANLNSICLYVFKDEVRKTNDLLIKLRIQLIS
ncbi:DUF2007 domain-containing protein [Flavobacteriaceae bacterium]|jgi:hypothetical protein|nr:DUF2007 domain-containing protein [Flavobacteriaceae bacterium]|tara:strand:+ start:57 stop:293 length:237 start_codon:yes stop_codon:yes gene_type:complete